MDTKQQNRNNNNDIILSKRLSYLLRHGAIKEGLNIKSNGFIRIDELLNKSLCNYTVDDIKRVVKNNNKQRFTLNNNNGVLEIKVNQGHSIPEITDLNLKILDCIESDIIHGTYSRYWPKIKREGLSRMKRNHIHFAKGLNFVNGLRQNAELFIYINFEKAKRDGLIFFESDNGVILCAGNSKGFIDKKYFLKVITAHGQILNPNQQTMDKRTLQQGISYTSICISSIPKNLSQEEILDTFRQFGLIREHCLTADNCFIIHYFSSNSIYNLLSEFKMESDRIFRLNVIFKLRRNRIEILENSPNGPLKLMITPITDTCKKKKSKKPPNNIEKEITGEEASPACCIWDVYESNKETSFENQVSKLIERIELSDAELLKYHVIQPHLVEIFKPIFPENKIHRFGSTVTGLSFKGCDFDLYMDVGNISLLRNCYGALSTRRRTLEIFKTVKKVMYSKKSVFSNIVLIPNARTPIIKFVYVPTNVQCDLSFKDALGIHKSNLIKYYATLDVRLRPLMMFIKFWAEVHCLTSKGRMSNYGLLCLIIFYLQQESVALVPVVKDLQRSPTPHMINTFRVDFDKNFVLLSKNNSSIRELLHGFFSFYSLFNFDTDIICLLDGKSHSKYSLMDSWCKEISYLDKPFDKRAPLCLQDPIELNQNTTAVTPNDVVYKFQHYCAFYAELCATYTCKDFFVQLFKIPLLDPTITILKRFGKVCFNNTCLDVGLPIDFETRTDIVNKWQYKKDNWFCNICNLIKSVLEYVFKLEVLVQLGNEAKYQQLKILSDVHVKNKKINLMCTGKISVWYNRAKFNKNLLDVQLSALEKEAIVSTKVYEQAVHKVHTVPLRFLCTLHKDHRLLEVFYAINNRGCYEDDLDEFYLVLKDWLQDIIDQTLSNMSEYKKTYSELICHKSHNEYSIPF